MTEGLTCCFSQKKVFLCCLLSVQQFVSDICGPQYNKKVSGIWRQWLMRLKKSRRGFSLWRCPVGIHTIFTCVSLPRSLMLRQSSQPDL